MKLRLATQKSAIADALVRTASVFPAECLLLHSGSQAVALPRRGADKLGPVSQAQRDGRLQLSAVKKVW